MSAVPPPFSFASWSEVRACLGGAAIVLAAGPVTGLIVFSAVVWEAIDRGFRGGFVQSGKELSGVLLGTVAPFVNRATAPFNRRFFKKAEDAYMANAIILFGIFLPALFFWLARDHLQRKERGLGVNLWYFWAYHVLRIGPYFMNFAYVYTLCHKEGHSKLGLYAKGYNTGPLRHVFNWWIGLFYGVMPASFAIGHSLNHHRYNNGPGDVVSTSDKPRDSWKAFLCYMPRWLLYSSNLATYIQFMREKNPKVANKTLVGSAYYVCWIALIAQLVDPAFALAFLGYPFFENVLLLSCVNWSWHAFLDPDDPSDEYVQSITILDGSINVLNEDYHVVHHQYPGAHWTEHPALVEKHWAEYENKRGSVFRGTHAFEVFAMVLIGDYDMLASKFVDTLAKAKGVPELTHDEKKTLLMQRVRGVWWGPRAKNVAYRSCNREEDPAEIERLKGLGIDGGARLAKGEAKM